MKGIQYISRKWEGNVYCGCLLILYIYFFTHRIKTNWSVCFWNNKYLNIVVAHIFCKHYINMVLSQTLEYYRYYRSKWTVWEIYNTDKGGAACICMSYVFRLYVSLLSNIYGTDVGDKCRSVWVDNSLTFSLKFKSHFNCRVTPSRVEIVREVFNWCSKNICVKLRSYTSTYILICPH